VNVPFNDLARVMPARKIIDAVCSVAKSARFIGGPFVTQFESDFAAYCDTRFCVGLSSGSSALQAALMAYDIGPGDEVITTSATFIATTAAIAHTGATPIFADINDTTLTLHPAELESAINSRTRAIVPVDLYGRVADMAAISDIASRNDLLVIEDAAQAHGAFYRGRRVGSLADVTCFSFHPAKNLGAIGDAGAVTTNDPAIAAKIQQLRNHGRPTNRSKQSSIGHNWRLDAIQAAVLSAKLPDLDEWNRIRRNAARHYDTLFAGSEFRTPDPGPPGEHVYHLYVIRHVRRDELRVALRQAGIITRVHYSRPTHRIMAPRYARRPLPHAENLAAECLSLPLFPGITDAEIDHVAATTLRFCAAQVL
jgi:dTDP-4-amino-4,6-dideoxygalactose transaminase